MKGEKLMSRKTKIKKKRFSIIHKYALIDSLTGKVVYSSNSIKQLEPIMASLLQKYGSLHLVKYMRTYMLE